MLCPVHHNSLRVAGAVSLVLEITEVAERTDNRGDTETRRPDTGGAGRPLAGFADRVAPRNASGVIGRPSACVSVRHAIPPARSAATRGRLRFSARGLTPPRLRASAVIRDLRHLR
jgi:hypothetical protein